MTKLYWADYIRIVFLIRHAPPLCPRGELLWYHSWLSTTDVPVMDTVEKYQVYPLWTAWVKAYTKTKIHIDSYTGKKKEKKEKISM